MIAHITPCDRPDRLDGARVPVAALGAGTSGHGGSGGVQSAVAKVPETTVPQTNSVPLRLAGGACDPLTCADWDFWVGQWSEASVFHTTGWMAVLADSYGFRPYACVVPTQAGRPALLPVMECSSPIFGRRGVSLPFTDAVPALAESSEQRQALWEQVLTLGRARKWRSVEWRGGMPAEGARTAISFYNHTLALEGTPDALWGRLDDPVRRALRKAARLGVEVRRETTWESVRHFYRLHGQTRRWHGLPPQPLSFFRHLHHHLIGRGAGCVFSAWHQGEVIAAAVFLQRGRRAIYKFGASDRSRQELRANNAVMWEAIRYFTASGLEWLDLGRTSYQQEGLRRFKLGWGARESMLNYCKFDLRRHTFVTAPDHSIGWHTAVFRRLPLPFLRWLGARLYPHLS